MTIELGTGCICEETTSCAARFSTSLKQVAPEADTAALDPERSFRDQLGIDSIDYLNFMIGLEERLGVRIAEIDYPKLSSLGGCLAYLRQRLPDRLRMRRRADRSFRLISMA